MKSFKVEFQRKKAVILLSRSGITNSKKFHTNMKFCQDHNKIECDLSICTIDYNTFIKKKLSFTSKRSI